MSLLDKAKILKGRKAVDVYRTAHSLLHSQPWDKYVPYRHTPLLNKLKNDLKTQNFISLDEFFTASEELNIQELAAGDILSIDEAWR